MFIEYYLNETRDFCENPNCGHAASYHRLEWDMQDTLKVRECTRCDCTKFALDTLSYAQRFPLPALRGND